MSSFKCPECNDTGEICVVNTFKVPCKKCPPPSRSGVTREQKGMILRQLFKTSAGLKTLSVSAKMPTLQRLHYKSVARKVWGRFSEVTDGVYLHAFMEDTGGEIPLPRHIQPLVFFEEAQDYIVNTLAGLEVEKFVQLLRTTPEIQTVEAPSIGAGLDKILESEELLAIVLEAKQLAPLRKAKQAKSPWPKNVLGHGRPFLYGELDVPLLTCREADGEVWAFVKGSGVSDVDVDLEITRDSIRWESSLKLAVVDSSKIFRVCSKENQRS